MGGNEAAPEMQMLLKHGFLFQANNGGEMRPSRLKRRIRWRHWVFGATREQPPWATQILKWTLGLLVSAGSCSVHKRRGAVSDGALATARPYGPAGLCTLAPDLALAQSHLQGSSLISFAANFDFFC
jgi:hypothetical protein